MLYLSIYSFICYFVSIFTSVLRGRFHRSSSVRKSLQFCRSLLNILADLNIVEVWVVLILPLITSSQFCFFFLFFFVLFFFSSILVLRLCLVSSSPFMIHSIKSQIKTVFSKNYLLVGWGRRIHRLHLCIGVRHPTQ